MVSVPRLILCRVKTPIPPPRPRTRVRAMRTGCMALTRRLSEPQSDVAAAQAERRIAGRFFAPPLPPPTQPALPPPPPPLLLTMRLLPLLWQRLMSDFRTRESNENVSMQTADPVRLRINAKPRNPAPKRIENKIAYDIVCDIA